MADSNFRGPINSLGALEVNAGTVSVEPLDGPSMFYQGVAYPDIRSAPFAKDGFRAGQQPAFASGSNNLLIDQIPQARTTTALAAAQAVTSMALVTAQVAGIASSAFVAVGVPIVPVGTTISTVAALALDFGFATGTTTTNSTTVAVVDNRVFYSGQWIVIGGAGNASASRSLITQVTNIGTANITTINISPAAVTGLSNVPIGQGNLYGDNVLPPATQFGPAVSSANAHSFGGALQAGLARIYNPREMLTRTLQINLNSAATMSALVSGWDLWGVPMTEVITLTAATTSVGKKAFKYVGAVTLSSNANTASVGLGDNVGLPLRADYWDQTYITWANIAAPNANGFLGAVTSAATSSTGDVRGTIALSTAILTSSNNGVIGTAVSATASNGTSRLTVILDLTPTQVVFATPLNPVPALGVTQSTATT